MNFSNVLNGLVGQSGNTLKDIQSKLPGGLAGGAVAGGMVAMLLSSKSARKTAGTVAKYGGTALLGGLAYKAYKSWQQNKTQAADTASGYEGSVLANGKHEIRGYEKEALGHLAGEEGSERFNIALVKAMIASARADGSIDAAEQKKISDAIQSAAFDENSKRELLELFIRPVAIEEFVADAQTTEQKAEMYLASCLVIELDDTAEYAHLSNLARALQLPPGLEQELRAQVQQSVSATV